MILSVRLAVAVGMGAILMLPCARAGQMLPLSSTKGLQPHKVTIEPVNYRGRKAIQVMPAVAEDAAWITAGKMAEGGGIAVIQNIRFHNGTIEILLAGRPRAGAPTEARGFVGVAFRVTADASEYEAIYLRPTNGRADDQLRRNHSVQYISIPDYEWSRLRRESPGKYESYVDLVPAEWTRIKIEVSGATARLYVNGAPQPTLIVNDLKLGDSSGAIALWVGGGTEAYFTKLRVDSSN
jgi:hypothetical protein